MLPFNSACTDVVCIIVMLTFNSVVIFTFNSMVILTFYSACADLLCISGMLTFNLVVIVTFNSICTDIVCILAEFQLYGDFDFHLKGNFYFQLSLQ